MTFNILIVDDDDVATESVVRGLRKHKVDCSITPAEDGRVALDILLNRHPDRSVERPLVILLDLNMPRMDGFEFLDALREHPSLNDLVVFILTTSDRESDMTRAYHRHVAGYMVKSAVGPQFSRLARLLDEYGSAVRLQ
jgi:CheY-like chemotaxis protein